MQPVTVSTIQLHVLYTVKEKRERPDRKPEPETSTKLYVHEFGFRKKAAALDVIQTKRFLPVSFSLGRNRLENLSF
jgi:hypothetical protein